MAASNSEKTKFPMLEAILAIKNLPLEPMYTTGGFAELFGVSARSIRTGWPPVSYSRGIFLDAGGSWQRTSRTSFRPV